MESLVAKAHVLVVGKVLEVAAAGTTAPTKATQGLPVAKMRARIQILRTFPVGGDIGLEKGQVISVPFQRVVWEAWPFVVINGPGPGFPRICVGDVLAFPLRRPEPGGPEGWQLTEDSLMPCAEEAPLRKDFSSGVAFLQVELANAFARGRYQDMFRAADYLRLWGKMSVDLVAVYQHLASEMQEAPEERWFRIAVVCYCPALPSPPRLAALLERPLREWEDPVVAFTVRVLSHVSREGLDERFIAEVFKRAPVHPWRSAKALSASYPQHPTLRKLLGEALLADRPEAVTIANVLLGETAKRDDPLIPTAVQAARRLLLKGESSSLGEAWQFVDWYGEESDLAPVLDKISTWQKTDRERYKRLWLSSGASARLRIPVIRIVIEDRRVLAGDVRFCDDAVLGLQIAARQRFGLSLPLPENTADRDVAVNRAKAWLITQQAG